MGNLRQLRSSTVATLEEALLILERERLHDSGCGAVDVSLLASVLLTSDALLWTMVRSLEALAARTNVQFRVPA